MKELCVASRASGLTTAARAAVAADASYVHHHLSVDDQQARADEKGCPTPSEKQATFTKFQQNHIRFHPTQMQRRGTNGLATNVDNNTSLKPEAAADPQIRQASEHELYKDLEEIAMESQTMFLQGTRQNMKAESTAKQCVDNPNDAAPANSASMSATIPA